MQTLKTIICKPGANFSNNSCSPVLVCRRYCETTGNDLTNVGLREVWKSSPITTFNGARNLQSPQDVSKNISYLLECYDLAVTFNVAVS